MSSEPLSRPAGRPRGRPRRSEDERAVHRTRLVEAAMDAVRHHGPDVSIDQIADAARVSKPVFYSEFGDKTGLVDAMAVVLAAGVERTVIDRVTADGNSRPDHIIGAIIEALIDLIDDEPRLYAYIVRSLRMRDRGLLDNALVRVIHSRASLIVGRLADELRDGELDILTDGIFGFVFGVIESWVATHRPAKDQLVETMTWVICGGLEAVTSHRAAPTSG